MSCLPGFLRCSREHKRRVANDFSGALFHHPFWNCKHELFLEVCKHVTLSWVLKIKGLKCTKCSIKPEGQGFTRIRPPWGRAKGAHIQENPPPRALHGIKNIISFLKKSHNTHPMMPIEYHGIFNKWQQTSQKWWQALWALRFSTSPSDIVPGNALCNYT